MQLAKERDFLKNITIIDSIKLEKATQVILSYSKEHQIDLIIMGSNGASGGIGSPLKLTRQYIKNIGRTLIVTTNTEKIEAELVDANEDFIILSWKAREPKKVGKGKETVQKEQQIPYTDIKEAVVTVTF